MITIKNEISDGGGKITYNCCFMFKKLFRYKKKYSVIIQFCKYSKLLFSHVDLLFKIK